MPFPVCHLWFTVARRSLYGPMLCDGFPHMLVSDSVFVGDAKDLSEASELLAIGFSSVFPL